jgi:crotonobetainyl-CoA:carnitine CoA-transferase CaiB-like acyl-CoA transferase
LSAQLAGIRVHDLTGTIVGPVCISRPADYNVEVIRQEAPGGVHSARPDH